MLRKEIVKEGLDRGEAGRRKEGLTMENGRYPRRSQRKIDEVEMTGKKINRFCDREIIAAF